MRISDWSSDVCSSDLDLFPDGTPAPDEPSVQLTDWDPDGEVKLVAAILYSATSVSEAVLEQRVRSMTAEERMAVVRAYVGDRSNRRHHPGRAFERLTYRFAILAEIGRASGRGRGVQKL